MEIMALDRRKGGKDMWKQLFGISLVVGLVLAGLLVPAAWAQELDAILGIQWQWTQLTETQPASQSMIANSENYVLVLNADGSANLQADCNQLQWTYTIDGDTISFNTLGPSTLAYCGDDSSDQIFLEKLGMASTWRVEDGRLVLELGENAGMMVFQNGGPADTAPATLPQTGGPVALAPWMGAVLTGLAALGTGITLRRKKR
jgi:LPXTG-motif cell wall-anchored protein